jgi:isopenicillin N synthase-like dioxygenase
MKCEGAAAELVAYGCARLRLGDPEARIVDAVRTAAAAFFRAGEQWKQQHGDEHGLYGYRPYGMQFSDDPALRDECESFAYWADRPQLVPGYEDLREFLTPLSEYWQLAAEVTSQVLSQLAAHYRYPHVLDTDLSSYVEINAYGQPPDRELLQTSHEDGHLITLVTPNKPGLEIEIDGTMRPEQGDGRDMVIMPGSLLTAMTGGDIQPLYHQVRNFMLPGRLTVLYFVNTPFAGDVTPYVRNATNRKVDMAALAVQKCTLFGKPPPRVLV